MQSLGAFLGKKTCQSVMFHVTKGNFRRCMMHLVTRRCLLGEKTSRNVALVVASSREVNRSKYNTFGHLGCICEPRFLVLYY